MEAEINGKDLVMGKGDGIVKCQCSSVEDKWGIKRKIKMRSGRSIKMFCRNYKCSNTVLYSFLTVFVLGILVGSGFCWETGRK